VRRESLKEDEEKRRQREACKRERGRVTTEKRIYRERKRGRCSIVKQKGMRYMAE